MKVVESAALRAWIDANERDEAVVDDPAIPPSPPTGDPVPLGVPGNWALVFRDEFEGAELDTTIWNANWLGAPGTVTKPVNSAELAAYDPSMVIVSNGCLRLTAIESPVKATDGKTYQYRSGLVESYKGSDGRGIEFTYGVFEARIQMSMGAALPWNWGAFWLNGRHVSWPDHGETDIMENLSDGPGWYYHAPGVDVGKDITGNWEGWHTYAVEWAHGRLRFYYDGNLVGEVTSGVLSYPQYMVLNYGISTQHGGPLAVPNTMLVDWVRVWRAS